jgi:hypothetical protein
MNLLPAFVVKIHCPVVDLVGSLLRQHVASHDTQLVLADLDELAGLADDFTLAFLQLDRQRQFVLLVEPRCEFDIGHVVEADLSLLDSALVKDFRRDRLGAPGRCPSASPHPARRQPHLELEGQHVHAGRVALAAFCDDFFNKQTPDRQVDRTDHNQALALLATRVDIATVSQIVTLIDSSG